MRENAGCIQPGEGWTSLLSQFETTESARGKKRRPRRPLAVSGRSARVYVRINSSKVHLFRFFLETEENLGIMTVVDRWGAVLLVRFSPHQEREMRAFLESMQESIGIEMEYNPCDSEA